MLINETDLQPSKNATDLKVLIVEDELLIALDLEYMVTRAGLDVAGLAADSEHARRLAPYADIAFVDVNLADGATGPEIGRMLAENYGVTVVFMTGNPEMIAEGVNGTLGVVTKPAMPRAIEQTLEYAAALRTGGNAAAPPEMRVFHS